MYVSKIIPEVSIMKLTAFLFMVLLAIIGLTDKAMSETLNDPISITVSAETPGTYGDPESIVTLTTTESKLDGLSGLPEGTHCEATMTTSNVSIHPENDILWAGVVWSDMESGPTVSKTQTVLASDIATDMSVILGPNGAVSLDAVVTAVCTPEPEPEPEPVPTATLDFTCVDGDYVGSLNIENPGQVASVDIVNGTDSKIVVATQNPESVYFFGVNPGDLVLVDVVPSDPELKVITFRTTVETEGCLATPSTTTPTTTPTSEAPTTTAPTTSEAPATTEAPTSTTEAPATTEVPTNDSTTTTEAPTMETLPRTGNETAWIAFAGSVLLILGLGARLIHARLKP